jgi:hypothetical protein
MRYYIYLLIVIFITSSIAVSSIDQDGAENDDLISFAGDLLDLLVEEKFDSLAMHFDDQMSTALPVEQLAQTWQTVLMQAGNFKRKVDEQTLTQQGYDVVIFRCEFENAFLNAQFVFNEKREISGLFLRPAEQ